MPLSGGFVAGLERECYMFYDEIYKGTIKFDVKTLRFFYLDYGCQYGRNVWTRIGRPRPEWLKIVVPWMHAHGHSDKCHALFSALYTEGAARCIGESMEQLWSELYTR